MPNKGYSEKIMQVLKKEGRPMFSEEIAKKTELSLYFVRLTLARKSKSGHILKTESNRPITAGRYAFLYTVKDAKKRRKNQSNTPNFLEFSKYL